MAGIFFFLQIFVLFNNRCREFQKLANGTSPTNQLKNLCKVIKMINDTNCYMLLGHIKVLPDLDFLYHTQTPGSLSLLRELG